MARAKPESRFIWRGRSPSLVSIGLIIRNDQYLLTGCLTFYNVEFKNVVIEASNQVCEDSVNLVNTRGNIDSISISSSVSDGLDIDFSNIYVSNITIKDSFNDCLDLSGGSYFIESIVLAGCDDKGISIGETSEVKIDNVLIVFEPIFTNLEHSY